VVKTDPFQSGVMCYRSTAPLAASESMLEGSACAVRLSVASALVHTLGYLPWGHVCAHPSAWAMEA
jgi:hypothetical protein